MIGRQNIKKIVFIVGPISGRGQNANCCMRFLDYFFDYEIHVIYYKDSLSKEITDNQNVYYHEVTTKTKDKRLYIESKVNKSKSIKRALLQFGYFIFRGYNVLKDFSSKTVINNELVLSYYDKLSSIDNIDLIIPVSWPFESLMAAEKYNKKHNTAYIPIVFDKFTTSRIINRGILSQKIKFNRQFGIEFSIFSNAKCVIATNDWNNYVTSYYNSISNKFKFIEVPALRRDLAVVEKNDNCVLYAGMLDRFMRNPQKTLRLIYKSRLMDVSWQFAVKGNCSSYVINAAKKDKRIKYLGTVSNNDASMLIQKAKILLSIGNSDITQTPSKVFEYICTSKPIIHIYSQKGDRIVDILKRYDNALCIYENDNEDVNAHKMDEFISRTHFRQYSIDEIFELFSEASPEIVAKIIHSYFVQQE